MRRHKTNPFALYRPTPFGLHDSFLRCRPPARLSCKIRFLFISVFPSPDDIVVIAGKPVDQTFRRDLHDSVGDGVGKLMVVRSEDHIALEIDQTVVDRRDGLQIQMVGRLVENQNVCAEEHHSGEHTSDLLAS